MAQRFVSPAVVVLLWSVLLIQQSYGWAPTSSYGASKLINPSRSGIAPRPFAIAPLAVASLTVESLENHDQVGSELGLSVQRWLDAEWMIQDCHVRIGSACKDAYVQCRQRDEHDLMVIMMQVAETLQSDWRELYDDAFVNAWDISNYVSDYLTAKVGVEGCECSAKIY